MSSSDGPQAEGNLMAGWVPIQWAWNDGDPLVKWCELGDLRLTAPFFGQTLHATQERSLVVRQTSAAVLAELPETGPGARPSGLIFHLSRCGSTLAAQALAALPENIVLSEAQTVDDVLHASMIFPNVTSAECISSLRGLARAYGWRRFPEEARFFVKFDTWHILHFEMIRAAFPGVPWVFLYRDPVEILVSQLTEVSGRMLPGPTSAAYVGMPLIKALQTSQEEFCALALGRIATAGIEAAERDPQLGRLVNYAQMPEALETVIAPRFGVSLNDGGRERMWGAMGFHSKSPGRVFTGDRETKQRLATAELRALADRWVRPAYDRLEEMRVGQPPR